MGQPGNAPVAGDWDDDGGEEVGVFRPGDPNVNTNNFWFRRADTSIIALTDMPGFGTGYGDRGDLGVTGDWDGDGDHNIGLYRPSTASRFTDITVPIELGLSCHLLTRTHTGSGSEPMASPPNSSGWFRLLPPS